MIKIKILSKRIIICNLFLILFLGDLIGGPITRKDLITVSSPSYQYGLILPANFNPKKKYLLGICLHGLGGNGVEFALKLSYYSRYMNMILACPNGNIPDPTRKSTKWGYDKSEEFILNFESMLREKYNLFPGTLLIGFSQGGNQGILTSLMHPTLFPYFIGISGGYNDLSPELEQSLPEVKMLLLSGDRTSGEVFTKKALDAKFKLYNKHKNISRQTIKGEKHHVSNKMAYSAFKWYASVNKNFKKRFWVFKGNYFYYFKKAVRFKKEGKFKESKDYYKKSLVINPVFPPSHLGYCRSSLMMGSVTQFRKSIFKVLEFYSFFPEYESSDVFELFDDVYKTFKF
ncbi:MAG: hypothetical protein KDK36_03325, partial [Leptospiraceae bacterium]|nr:hypothetical protein [Leptospiraceae bacterium]